MTNRLCVVVMLTAALAMGADEPKQAGAPKKAGETVITAKKLDFDYKNYIAVFEGDVVVTDPEIKMQAEKMTLAFDTNSNIRIATATGDVKVWRQDTIASGKRVVYQAANGRIQLIGDARLARGQDVVVGDRITVWVNEDRVECVPGHLVVAPRKDGGENSLKKLLPGKQDGKGK